MRMWDEVKNKEIFPLGGKPGVYVIFDHRGVPKYVGSSDRVWDRIGGKHVAGADTHAVQRAYALAIQNRDKRREFIRKFVKVTYIETDSLEEAQKLENGMLAKYKPAWNVKGIPGKTASSPGVVEAYDAEYMEPYA